MHPEIKRLLSDFGWQSASIFPAIETNLFASTEENQVTSAYSDILTSERGRLYVNSWWSQTRNRIINQALTPVPVGSVIWDVGCGTGFVSMDLLANGRQVVGIEPSRAGAQITAQAGIPTFQTTLERLELPSNSLAAVSLFDVLEHVQSREHMLHELHRVLQPGGFLVLTVPALKILWSQFDEDESHQVRYTKSKLQTELESSGFTVNRIGYFFALTVPLLLLLRALPYRIGIKKSLSVSAGHAAQRGLLGKLAGLIEIKLALLTPIGSSLLALAQKSETANQ